MKTLITTLNILGIVTILVTVIFLIKIIVLKATFHPSNMRNQISKKYQQTFINLGIFIVATIFVFGLAKQIVKNDFKEKIANNKIVLLEINGTYFNQNEAQDIFKNFIKTEGRLGCEKSDANIKLENNITIPVEISRHCYYKNRYMIVSKNYDIKATIGDIITDKFDFINR